MADITPWFVGETEITLINGENYLEGLVQVTNSIGAEADAVTLELFNDDCETVQPLNSTTSSIFIDESDATFADSVFTYEVEIVESNFVNDTGDYLTLEEDSQGGNSVGFVSFCTRVNSYEGDLIISTRETIFNFDFNLTSNPFDLDSNITKPPVPPAPTPSPPPYNVSICQCKEFECQPYSVEQYGSLSLCLQPNEPEQVEITNLAMSIYAGEAGNGTMGSFYSFDPVWYGNGTYESPSFVTIEKNETTQILMVKTPMLAEFFIGAFTSVDISGNAWLEFIQNEDGARAALDVNPGYNTEINLFIPKKTRGCFEQIWFNLFG